MAISLEILSSIRKAARNIVCLEMCLSTSGVPLVRVYGGIVGGVQVVECDNEDDRLEAFNDLYSFYRKLGKAVRLSDWRTPNSQPRHYIRNTPLRRRGQSVMT